MICWKVGFGGLKSDNAGAFSAKSFAASRFGAIPFSPTSLASAGFAPYCPRSCTPGRRRTAACVCEASCPCHPDRSKPSSLVIVPKCGTWVHAAEESLLPNFGLNSEATPRRYLSAGRKTIGARLTVRLALHAVKDFMFPIPNRNTLGNRNRRIFNKTNGRPHF